MHTDVTNPKPRNLAEQLTEILDKETGRQAPIQAQIEELAVRRNRSREITQAIRLLLDAKILPDCNCTCAPSPKGWSIESDAGVTGSDNLAELMTDRAVRDGVKPGFKAEAGVHHAWIAHLPEKIANTVTAAFEARPDPLLVFSAGREVQAIRSTDAALKTPHDAAVADMLAEDLENEARAIRIADLLRSKPAPGPDAGDHNATATKPAPGPDAGDTPPVAARGGPHSNSAAAWIRREALKMPDNFTVDSLLWLNKSGSGPSTVARATVGLVLRNMLAEKQLILKTVGRQGRGHPAVFRPASLPPEARTTVSGTQPRSRGTEGGPINPKMISASEPVTAALK